MEFNELIESRRSVRVYKEGTSITSFELESIIEAAQQAPSWKNSQTARYYVAHSDLAMKTIREKCLPNMNKERCENAVALIVTTFVKNRAGFNKEGVADNELGNEWGAYDLGLQNALLLLKAKDLGYDSLVMGLRNAKMLREKLEIPDTEEVVSVIVIGKKDEEPSKPPRKAIADIAKFL